MNVSVAGMNLLFEGQEIVQDVDGGGAAGRDVLHGLVSLDVDRVGALSKVNLEHLDATYGRIEGRSELVADVTHIVLLGVDQCNQTFHHFVFHFAQIKNQDTSLEDYNRDTLQKQGVVVSGSRIGRLDA